MTLAKPCGHGQQPHFRGTIAARLCEHRKPSNCHPRPSGFWAARLHPAAGVERPCSDQRDRCSRSPNGDCIQSPAGQWMGQVSRRMHARGKARLPARRLRPGARSQGSGVRYILSSSSESPHAYCQENSTFAAPYFRGGLPIIKCLLQLGWRLW